MHDALGRVWWRVTEPGPHADDTLRPGGALTLLGSTPVRASGGVGAVDARLSPAGHFLYVDRAVGAVGAFAVDGANLTELAGSATSLPAGAGIVVTG